ncbi:MAG: YlxR family protein [Fimbriimonadales bacterium]|nr:YlxR family protein [Fimbriimonadales bacterium]MDW8051040.1 YlxR family protein [Armatimonadota bacterium]
MPKKKSLHSPIRRCAACRRTAPKHTLLRFVRDPQTRQVAFDPSQRLPGRGAYLCPNAECFRLARKRKSLERALNAPIPEAVLQAAQAQLEREQLAS